MNPAPLDDSDLDRLEQLLEADVFQGDAMRFEITVEVQEEFPEVCRHQTQGFIEHASSYASGGRVRMSSTRVSPTRIQFVGQSK